ncbi:hypothetical protein EON66_09715, partial [archaeon]
SPTSALRRAPTSNNNCKSGLSSASCGTAAGGVDGAGAHCVSIARSSDVFAAARPPLTPASDVHAFGVLAWGVLSRGCARFVFPLARGTCHDNVRVDSGTSALSPRPDAVHQIRGVPPEVIALVQRCFQPSAADRPTAMHVVDVLTAVLHTHSHAHCE